MCSFAVGRDPVPGGAGELTPFPVWLQWFRGAQGGGRQAGHPRQLHED